MTDKDFKVWNDEFAEFTLRQIRDCSDSITAYARPAQPGVYTKEQLESIYHNVGKTFLLTGALFLDANYPKVAEKVGAARIVDIGNDIRDAVIRVLESALIGDIRRN